MRKFKRAVTDSESEVRFSEDKPGVSNLMTIYRAFTGKTFDEIERELADTDIVIADSTHGVGLAGVMGGLETEVEESTKNVLT